MYSNDQMPSLTQSQFSPASDAGETDPQPAQQMTLADMAAAHQRQAPAPTGSGVTRQGVNNPAAHAGEEFESGSESFSEQQGNRLDVSGTVV